MTYAHIHTHSVQASKKEENIYTEHTHTHTTCTHTCAHNVLKKLLCIYGNVHDVKWNDAYKKYTRSYSVYIARLDISINVKKPAIMCQMNTYNNKKAPTHAQWFRNIRKKMCVCV